MVIRKTAHGNQDKNIVILEKIYLLGRCILVRKATGNKTFQPAPLQTTYFQLDENLFSLLSFKRSEEHLYQEKKNLNRKNFQRSKRQIWEYSPVRSHHISHVLTCRVGWICQTCTTRVLLGALQSEHIAFTCTFSYAFYFTCFETNFGSNFSSHFKYISLAQPSKPVPILQISLLLYHSVMYLYVFSSCTWSGRYTFQFNKYECIQS